MIVRFISILSSALFLAGCASPKIVSQNNSALALPPRVTLPVATPSGTVETRYEIRGYREALDPALRHEAHAVFRSTRIHGNVPGSAEVVSRTTYLSPSMVALLKKPKNITRDALTPKEQMVLSVIGDGSDDREAGERLRISPHTVNSHRKAIMGKLGLHHKGQVIRYAQQQGYIRVTPTGVDRPGFQRRIRGVLVERPAGEHKA